MHKPKKQLRKHALRVFLLIQTHTSQEVAQV